MKKIFFIVATVLAIASAAAAGPIRASGRLTGTGTVAVLKIAGKAAGCVGKAAGKAGKTATKAVAAVVKTAY